MALSSTALKKIGGAGDSNLFMYQSTDAVGTVAGSGYFNDVTNELKQFDVIIVVGSTGGTATVDVLIVSSATGAATVTCTNGT
jgi:hypothetical protein|tara:strand:+ start:2543 stop:2791 length:249 start_codon:yes stop_codon:yes gene_type:complete